MLCFSSTSWAKENGDPPLIEHVEVLEAPRGQDLEVLAIIKDESGIFDPALLYRVGSEGEFKRLPMKETDKEDGFRASIPGDEVNTDLEYFLEAYDMEGNGPARFGDVDLPIAVHVVTPTETIPESSTKKPNATGPSLNAKSVGEGNSAPDDDESEGSSLLLWSSVGGGVVLTLAAAAATTAVLAYVFLANEATPERPSEVQLTISAPTPISSTLILGEKNRLQGAP